ncbi:hypothetical protein CQ040_16630 [Microbacterium sp. MYb54]|nr:hypothetical protein CQ032_15980 [Microbacterium sp. MYb43]PQZ74741.1 hypothetical protein CQ031_15325 [Microbacterium sp. MYb40]PRB18829.1 hypothetical protein CQ040_16630 [Microbacterium sp. MYb54]PRB23689.1 hypothetical protein CQ037_17430 [Microbacterium sp. MYb50]PRB63303.1 hypothetical protein CQ021_16475 [Microbacterium sp. MYb24]PRB71902.1 hypothetical protein CQ027_15745 [Microbacterium sp. MYb32]
MARIQRRRGSLIDPVIPGWRIERQNKERAEAIASRAGVSTSELIEQLLEHVELTDQGIPTWMPPRDRDGELPIDTA